MLALCMKNNLLTTRTKCSFRKELLSVHTKRLKVDDGKYKKVFLNSFAGRRGDFLNSKQHSVGLAKFVSTNWLFDRTGE